MKKIIFLMSFLTIVGFSSASAQEQNSKDVPKNVSSAFAKMYPTVKNVKWEKEEGNYEGKFSMNRKSMSVQFNEKGELVQKETYIKVSELPKNAQDYLTKNYAGVKFEKASKVTDAKNVLHYQAETKGKTLFFDDNGNFLKEEKED